MPGRDGRSGGLRTGGGAGDRAQAVRRDLLSRPRGLRVRFPLPGTLQASVPAVIPVGAIQSHAGQPAFSTCPCSPGPTGRCLACGQCPACLGRERPSGPRASLSPSLCRTLGSSMGHHTPSVREPACCLGPDYPCSVPAPGPSSGSRLKLPVQRLWGDSWTPPAGSESRAPR